MIIFICVQFKLNLHFIYAGDHDTRSSPAADEPEIENTDELYQACGMYVHAYTIFTPYRYTYIHTYMNIQGVHE